jgi:hypothetical protein
MFEARWLSLILTKVLTEGSRVWPFLEFIRKVKIVRNNSDSNHIPLEWKLNALLMRYISTVENFV